MNNQWMIQGTNSRGELGMIAPTTLHFETKAEAETVAERYRQRFPEQRFVSVLVNAQGFIIREETAS